MDWKEIGSVAGILSFIWLLTKDSTKLVRYFFRKPRLKIYFDAGRDQRVYTFPDGTVRKFVTLHVRNKNGAETARRCVPILKVLTMPCAGGALEREYSLHWANVPYSARTTGAEPVDIGTEEIRLDVVFTDQRQSLPGCWVSMPIALSGNLIRNQAHFVPGEYEVEIKVTCENGAGDRKKFRIASPSIWDHLEMDIVD